MKKISLNSSQTVADVIQQHPETLHTWITLKTDCVGCYMMNFCSLDYVAKSYHIKVKKLCEELEKAITG